MVLRFTVMIALITSTTVFAKPRTGMEIAKVTDFAVGEISPKFKACVLTVDVNTKSNKRLGLVIDTATCEKNFAYYKKLMGKDVEFKRADYKLIKDADLLAQYKEYNSELFYVKLKAGAKVGVSKPAVARVEKINVSLAHNAFGTKSVCVVFLKFASDNDKIGAVFDTPRCEKEGYSLSLVGKDVSLLQTDLQYLRSGNQIRALEAIDDEYFYKAYADTAPALSVVR